MKAKGGFPCMPGNITMPRFWHRSRFKLGMERVKEEKMGAEEGTCVCTGNEGQSSAPVCLSWSHSSTPHSYKCPTQQATKQPPLWLWQWQTWATTSPLSQDFTSWAQKGSQQQPLNSLGKLNILSTWARAWTTTGEISMIISIYETSWTKKLSTD